MALHGIALDAIEKVAKQFKGTVDPGSLFRRPVLRCSLQGLPLEVRWGPRGSDEQRIEAKVRGGDALPGTLMIWTNRPLESLNAGWRKRPPKVSSGDPELDREFAFRIAPPSLAKHLFAPERREKLIKVVRSLSDTDDLSLAGGTLELSSQVYHEVRPGALVGLIRQLQDLVKLLLDAARSTTGHTPPSSRT